MVLNVMDVRREIIPFPWNTVRERALKVFVLTWWIHSICVVLFFSLYFHVYLLAFQPQHFICRLIMLFTVACMVLVCSGISQCVCLSWTLCNSPGYTKPCVTSPGYTKHCVTKRFIITQTTFLNQYPSLVLGIKSYCLPTRSLLTLTTRTIQLRVRSLV